MEKHGAAIVLLKIIWIVNQNKKEKEKTGAPRNIQAYISLQIQISPGEASKSFSLTPNPKYFN